jgi:RNA polymerase sigma-70 factor (ECF subfamily)
MGRQASRYMAINIQNDTELWQLVRQSDHAAYEVLYQRYMEVIFAGIFKHLDSRADAEDIMQEVFLTIWEQRQTIDLKYKFFSYLYSVTRYKTYKYLKDKKLTARYEILWEEQQTASYEEDSIAPDAFRIKDMEFAEYKIDQEIVALPVQMKKVYQLKIEHGLTVPQIAEQLIVSEHTVKKQLALLKKRLRGAALQLF